MESNTSKQVVRLLLMLSPLITAAQGFALYESAGELGLGAPCNGSLPCISNAKCDLESVEPVCKCDSQYVPSNDFMSCIKKVGIGVECEESYECPMGAGCVQRNSKKYCTCKEDFVPSYDRATCLQKVTLGESCLESSQCIFQAECLRDPWSPPVCKCIDGLEPSQDNLYCAEKIVRLGDACNDSYVCDVVDAFCNNEICDCRPGFVRNAAGDACIPRVDIGQKCNENTQCIEHSKCKKVCTCNNGYKQKGKKCLQIFQVGESCSTDDECGKFAVCDHEKCTCTEGFVPNSKPDYDCKAALHGYCNGSRTDCLYPDVMVCTTNECVCKDTYEDYGNICMGALGDTCMAGGCYTNFSECNRKTKKCTCIEGYQQVNTECAAALKMPCTQSGGCINRFSICGKESTCTCDEGYYMSADSKTCLAGYQKLCTIEDGCWDASAKCWRNSVSGSFQCECAPSHIYDKQQNTCRNGAGDIKISALYVLLVSAFAFLRMH